MYENISFSFLLYYLVIILFIKAKNICKKKTKTKTCTKYL